MIIFYFWLNYSFEFVEESFPSNLPFELFSSSDCTLHCFFGFNLHFFLPDFPLTNCTPAWQTLYIHIYIHLHIIYRPPTHTFCISACSRSHSFNYSFIHYTINTLLSIQWLARFPCTNAISNKLSITVIILKYTVKINPVKRKCWTCHISNSSFPSAGSLQMLWSNHNQS